MYIHIYIYVCIYLTTATSIKIDRASDRHIGTEMDL